MKYIYESPDKGKTVYRRPVGNPSAKRELVNPVIVHVDDLIEEQLVFVNWLKENGLYYALESGRTMHLMFEVWKKATDELTAKINELSEN